MYRSRLTRLALALAAFVVLPAANLNATTPGPQQASSAKKPDQAPSAPNSTPAPAANSSDVKSIDAVVAALYDVISGPPGDRDWNRMRSLFLPQARLIPARKLPDESFSHNALTVEEYISRTADLFKHRGFFESEISRKTDAFGTIAHVFSTYESRQSKDAASFARGINSIELVNDGSRWWVATVVWDSERDDNPIPAKYLQRK